MIKIFRYNSSMQEDILEFITNNMSNELDVKNKATFDKIVYDLKDIDANYIQNGGELLFAYDLDIKKIAGTIAVKYENDIAVMKRFYVAPEYRSQKIGYMLYLELENVMRSLGINKVYLTTGKELGTAHRFYERNGWTKEEDNPGIYCRTGADLYKKEIEYREADYMENVNNQADILVEAIPYIKEFVGKTIIIKCGTNTITEKEQEENLVKQVALLKMLGINIVLVHGGTTDIEEKLRMNTELIKALNLQNIKPVGLSGLDDKLITCTKKGEDVILNTISPELLLDLLAKGYTPVVTSIGVDQNDEYCSIDSDIVASDIAISLEAKKIIFLTDTNGVMDKNGNLISMITAEKIEELIQDGTITGGMIPKINACVACLKNGVERTHILNGTVKNTIIYELLSKNGIGTMII